MTLDSKLVSDPAAVDRAGAAFVSQADDLRSEFDGLARETALPPADLTDAIDASLLPLYEELRAELLSRLSEQEAQHRDIGHCTQDWAATTRAADDTSSRCIQQGVQV